VSNGQDSRRGASQPTVDAPPPGALAGDATYVGQPKGGGTDTVQRQSTEERLVRIAARIRELTEERAKLGPSDPKENDLWQEQKLLEQEERKLRRRLQPDGGKLETRLVSFSLGVKWSDGHPYVFEGLEKLDAETRARVLPKLQRIDELQRMILDDLGRVIRAGPSPERDRRGALLDEWEALVKECQTLGK